MSANGEIQPLESEKRSNSFDFLAPAALAVGGTLSLVWACALGLCTYDLVRWLFA